MPPGSLPTVGQSLGPGAFAGASALAGAAAGALGAAWRALVGVLGAHADAEGEAEHGTGHKQAFHRESSVHARHERVGRRPGPAEYMGTGTGNTS